VLAVELNYERLQTEYEEKIVRGIPMSVHERYRNELAGLREELRAEPHNRRLGEILLDMGAIDEHMLSQALTQQKTNEEKLLGEILVDQGCVDIETVRRAIKEQVNREEVVRV